MDQERSNPRVQSAPATLNYRSTVDTFLHPDNQGGFEASQPLVAIHAIQI